MASISNTRVVRTQFVARDEKITAAHVKTETVQINTQLNDGEVLIRNLYLGLDPYNRYLFQNQGSASADLEVTVTGLGVGEVVESKASAFPVKSIVLGFGIGWEQYTRVSNTRTLWIIPDPHNPKVPLIEYLGALGANGITAYTAVEALVKFKKDQVVYISSAAGPVGGFLSILAQRQGAFVIGSTGSDVKVEYLLKDLGLNAAINYKTKDLRSELDAVAPKGIDIYFDLVGGETFDIALEKLKPNGQVVAIGTMSAYGSKTPYVTKNLSQIVTKALTINGFTLFQHLHKFPQFWKEYVPLIANGEIKSQRQTVIKGLENIPQTFADYLDGKYSGKVIIEVANLFTAYAAAKILIKIRLSISHHLVDKPIDEFLSILVKRQGVL
ncbi:hypothetical protein BGX21_001166 [Mortierella sp. AD011]|nr:hypothetical protein BGX21_001166 [Mortierella sp. AD011]